MDDAADTVRLWRATGHAERELIAASRWRAWPRTEEPFVRFTADRSAATETAREWHVPREGVGYVMGFDVRSDFLKQDDVDRVPHSRLDDLNASIVGAIREISDYRGPVGDDEFADAASYFGAELPPAWRAYLQGPSWYRRGWLTDMCFLWLQAPSESVELTQAWEPATSLHSGVAFIGSDGGAEHLALDLRHPSPPVVSLPNVSNGWENAIEQAASVTEFVERVEDGSFDFRWDDE